MRKLLLPLLAALACHTAGAAGFPDHSIRLVVPFAAGGQADLIARQFAEHLGAELKQSVVVDNRTGAGSTIGTATVARADPDGYTLLFTTFSHVVNATLYQNLPYDSVADFAPVSMISNTYLVLTTAADAPFKTVQDLVAAVREKPASYNYGTAGVGSGMHIITALFNHESGMDGVVHVPYRGGSQVLPAIRGKEVTYAFPGMDAAIPLIQAGELKALAVTSAERDPRLPDIPTLQEAGLKGFDVGNYLMLLAPKGTPEAIVDRLNEATNHVLNSESFTKLAGSMAGVRLMPDYTPASTAAFLRDEVERWAPIVKNTGAKVE